ncbi:MAG: GNAT family N-acetyltransferase [Patescibacteria group bacterium]
MNYSWKLSKFDTKVLGYNVAKIIKIETTGGDHNILQNIHELNKSLKENNIKYATYRVNANNYPTIHALGKCGYILVDGLITLETVTDLGKHNRNKHIRIATKNDLPTLLKTVGEVFNATRYYHDPVIPKEKADNIYKEWVKNTLHGKFGDMVVVWEERKRILGFITLDKKGQIPLVGVAKTARGKGIGRELVESVLNKFENWGAKKIIVETQMTNIPALKLYQSCGFKIADSHLTFRWYN